MAQSGTFRVSEWPMRICRRFEWLRLGSFRPWRAPSVSIARPVETIGPDRTFSDIFGHRRLARLRAPAALGHSGTFWDIAPPPPPPRPPIPPAPGGLPSCERFVFL